MTNEQMVEEIKKGININENMLMLYNNNLPLIKSCINQYFAYTYDQDDLLQEAFLGLWEAVEHYSADLGSKFMTYAPYRIKQRIIKYLNNSCSPVSMSNYMHEKIKKYKKIIDCFSKESGYIPSDSELARQMDVSIEEIKELKIYSQPTTSLDACFSNTEEESDTLGDILKSNFDLEESVLDKTIEEKQKKVLWNIVKGKVTAREFQILQDYFEKNLSLQKIAENENVSSARITEIKKRAIEKLKKTNVKRWLSEQFEIFDSDMYRNGYGKYCNNQFTSNVEKIAMKHLNTEERVYLQNYKKSVREVFDNA